jgi:hypothetical protein
MIIVNVYSQEADNTIQIEKRKFYQNGEKLTSNQLYSALSTNPASASHAQLARKNANISSYGFIIPGLVFVCIGSFTELNSSIKENQDIQNGNLPGEYNSGLGWIVLGGGLIIAGIPFSLKSRKHLNKSIEQYNSSVSSNGLTPVEFELMVNGNGMGIRMRF